MLEARWIDAVAPSTRVAKLGGLADECPTNFFFFFILVGNSKFEEQKKKKERGKTSGHGLTGESTFDHDLFPPPLPLPP